ncbi:hypothetical protein [Chitinophaga rhizophila]|uniref:Carboxypeptidase regulatory-like domain-containing protein n=1 Tax=Chitinophaga rhizophila TaxID=2866212 RepID=A0ABS7GM53_9BACT|nr:hypothetical protein [Chitinophaga rhizophila]MBW8687857.1 hypothetical protein [Chitinophaga rhizophila]
MRIAISFMTMAFVCLTGMSFAQRGPKPPKVLYPEFAFDSLTAREQLKRGKGTIQGIAFTKEKNSFGVKPLLAEKIYATNTKIILFPVTPYFDAWYQMRRKKEGKRTYVYMSDEAYRFRLETRTDSYGNFTFTEMKPGRYFLQAIVGWSTTHGQNVYSGSGYNGYGRTDYYTRSYYNVSHSDRIEEFVEVKESGEVVKVKLH